MSTDQPPTPPDPRPSQRGWRSAVRRWSLVLALGLALAVVLPWAEGLWWRLGLIWHFPLQQAGLAAVAVLMLLWVGPRRWAALPALIMIWHGSTVAVVHWPQPNTELTDKGIPLRVITANLLNNNPQPQAAAAWLRAQQADVVVCQEVNPAVAAALVGELSELPHRLVLPGNDAFGIALFSRWPLRRVSEHSFDGEVPSIIAVLEVAGVTVQIIATHPLPPASAELAQLNRDHLQQLATFVAAQPPEQPMVVLGDLNATPWSPSFRQLLAVGQLRDSRRRFGNHATWPSHLGYFGIPIDHVLVRGPVQVMTRWVSPHLGSDHRFIVCDLRLLLPAD